MRRFYALIFLLSLCLGAFSQEITVRFTGQLNGTSYCRLDSVAVTNLTRDWTETIEYPDTIIVLGGTVGIDLNIAATQGLGQNIPNPFDCETRVELSVSQRENVRMQLLDASGKQYAEYSGSLDAGVHTFDISAAAPQTYILNAVVGDKSYSIRMVNMGSGCGSSIKYAGISGSITAKLTSTNEFQNGDNMRYVGYMTIYGDIVASTAVEQAQTASEDITLNFAHCLNTFGTDIQSVCESYTWIDGVTYTESTNEPTFTLTNAAGCDSIVTLNLTINRNTGIDTQTACDSYTWIDGVTYTESTTEPTFTLTNTAGCDSVVTLHLTINHSNTGIEEQTACESYTWIDGVTYTESTNEPTFTLTNATGCDSVVTLHLTIKHSSTGIDEQSACDSYTWIDGVTYTESTTEPTFTLTNAAGCDSVVTLHLTINHSTTGIDEQTACESYTWIDGVTYTESTTEPTFTLTNAAGCDSVVTLHLTINHNTGIDTHTACENYTWIDGVTYTESTTEPTFTLTNVAGCDSVVTLHLTINHSSTNIDEHTACESYTWIDGVTYTESTNEPTFTLTNVVGCDSVVTLHLTIVCQPTVQTNVATDITSDGATIYGDVISDGGATVTARGFLYGTSENNLTEDVQSGNGTGSFSANLTALTSGTAYYYKAYATNSEGTAYGEVLSFTTLPTTGTQNGHEWVDLGLPSGARWATCNVGADTPEGYGNYYAWGETTTKETYSWATYIYAEGTSNNDPKLTKYCYNATYGNDGFTDEYTILLPEDDAATANWGTGWRMPIPTEMEELYNNCTYAWITENGVLGMQFTGPNGNSIFLPAAGVRGPSGLQEAGTNGKYYSSSLGTSYPRSARSLNISSDDPEFGNTYRNWGLSVRPVCASAPIVNTNVATNITLDGATLNGNIISDGGATVTDRGFLYGTSESDLTQTVQSGNGTGRFTANLTDLTSGATYYYKAYATNSIGTAYGEVVSFTTLSVPTVQTNAATNIIADEATISGNVTSDGGTDVTACGFIYGTDANSLTQTIQSGSGTGSFTSNLTSLTYGTTYYYKAYATNSVGTAYGEVLSFTTNSSANAPTVQTNAATNITTTGATLSGSIISNGDATITARGFMYGTDANNLTQTVQSGSGMGNFTKAITGLASAATYYYKAYATNSAGTAYGEVRTFTTPSGILNNHGWVDLGLSSHTVWATCNVGATAPEDNGNYYAWGETAPKNSYNTSNYTLGRYYYIDSQGYAQYDRYNSFDHSTTLESSDDAAAVNWGAYWRTPTRSEMDELISSCTHAWTTQNGVSGMRFTGPNGNSIFLPAAGWRYLDSLYYEDPHGYYWSSTLYTGNLASPRLAFAECLEFGSSNCRADYRHARIDGLTVRAVFKLASVTTGLASNITPVAATLSGTVTSDGGSTVVARGFIYGTDSNSLTQTVVSSITTDDYTVDITGLEANTTYYYRAYVTNNVATTYGDVRTFTTSPWSGTYRDTRDGNTYSYVTIGNQTWMAENLRYEGNIPLGSETSYTTAYRYYPNNNSGNVATYGYLYNWPAAMNGASSSSSNPSGVQGICPAGWHLPSDAEWTQLIDYLGSQSEYVCDENPANIAKSLASTTGWRNESATCAVGNNQSSNNSTGFNARPAGCKITSSYYYFGEETEFWTTEERNNSQATSRYFRSSDKGLYVAPNYKNGASSVRCLLNR